MKGFPKRTAKQRRRAAKRARQRALPTKRLVPGAHEPGRFVDYQSPPSGALTFGDPVLGAVLGALASIRARKGQRL